MQIYLSFLNLQSVLFSPNSKTPARVTRVGVVSLHSKTTARVTRAGELNLYNFFIIQCLYLIFHQFLNNSLQMNTQTPARVTRVGVTEYLYNFYYSMIISKTPHIPE